MAIKNQIVCDACGKAIAADGNSIQLTPLRGGLTVTNKSAAGIASVDVAAQMAFCNDNCVVAWLNTIVPKAK